MKGYRRKTSNTGQAKVGRGAAKKNMKMASPKSSAPPSQRMDEDSGLGGDSYQESAVEFSPKSELGINHDATESSLMFFGSSNNKEFLSHLSEPLTTRFTGPKSLKRPRLDAVDNMCEEANGLPDVKQCQETITSFKDVVPATLIDTSGSICISKVMKLEKCEQTVKVTSPKSEKTKKRPRHPLEGNLRAVSSDGKSELHLSMQPERQHRARYQTEGSRGAVKDESGSGHPKVQLLGYTKETTLQVFVASDEGIVRPHYCYQACKVCGKNSTPCEEQLVQGTIVLNITMLPEKDMTITCDCVGILKERNVDVEKKVKQAVSGRKKSTKCRLVFQTTITMDDGRREVLQVISQSISCTQLPGIPEISRKSLSECPVDGGPELFVIGKNFLKDTKVIFQDKSPAPQWSVTVHPDKEFLQTTHLICVVPPFWDLKIERSMDVDLLVESCGKTSDAQTLTYLPRPKETPVDLKPMQPLPKGVSLSAMEVNRKFAESGDITLPKELPLRNNFVGGTKEQAVVYPFCKSDAIAQEEISSLELVIKKDEPLPNSVPCVTEASKTEAIVKVSAAENLAQMLKLLKKLPENVQTPVVDLIAGEILKLGSKTTNEDLKKCNLKVVPVSVSSQLPYAIISPQLSRKSIGGQGNLRQIVCSSVDPTTPLASTFCTKYQQTAVVMTTHQEVIKKAPQHFQQSEHRETQLSSPAQFLGGRRNLMNANTFSTPISNHTLPPMFSANSPQVLNSMTPLMSESPQQMDSPMLNDTTPYSDSAIGLSMENCDPLLSQANPPPTLRMHPTPPSQGGMPEVASELPRLSDAELFSYISPNYFDQV